jgi:predicted secreted hydrolase
MELATIDPQTKEEVKWQIIPLARDQELAGRVTGLAYWEGGCRVVNGRGEEIGSAFLELTGYSGNLARSMR